MRLLTLLPPAALLLALSLSTGTAAAQEDTSWRFRGSVGGDAGAFIVPGLYTLGAVGLLQAQIGGQSGPLGIYVQPGVSFMFSPNTNDPNGGFSAGGAVMADYTFGERLSLGAGPEAHIFMLTGGDYNDTIAGGGWLAGGRLSLRAFPVLGHDGAGRRHALSLGVDMRVLAGDHFDAPEGAAGGYLGRKLVLWPALTIGYQRF